MLAAGSLGRGRACSCTLAIPASKRHKKQFFKKLTPIMTFLDTHLPETVLADGVDPIDSAIAP